MKNETASAPQKKVPSGKMLTESESAPPRAVTDGDIVLASVFVAAVPQRVFRAITSDEAETWWGSADTYSIMNWKADLRVGGQWSLGVRLPDGNVFPASGEFLEINQPGKIVQTRRYDFDHPTLGRRVTKVTYLLDPIADGTRVTVRHEDFASAPAAHEHAGGWERYLGWLQAHLNRESAAAFA